MMRLGKKHVHMHLRKPHIHHLLPYYIAFMVTAEAVIAILRGHL